MATFDYNGAVVRVRKERVRDRLHAEVIESKLSIAVPDALYWAVRQFAAFVTTAEVEKGEFPFSIPDVGAEGKVLASALDDWMDCDAALIDLWIKAHTEENTPKKTTEPPPDS